MYSARCTPRIRFRAAHMMFRTRDKMPEGVTGSSLTFRPVYKKRVKMYILPIEPMNGSKYLSIFQCFTIWHKNYVRLTIDFLTTSRILLHIPICGAIGKLYLIQVNNLQGLIPEILLHLCQRHLQGWTSTLVILMLQPLYGAVCVKKDRKKTRVQFNQLCCI